MNVVSDTSPLNYLVLIDAVSIIPQVYDRLYIPPTVAEEPRDEGSPPAVRAWATLLPDWVQVKTVTEVTRYPRLHQGEAEAIALAQQIQAKLLLIDDRAGREIAHQCGLQTLGVLGLLEVAAERGLIDLTKLVDRLMKTNFRVSRELLNELLRRSRGS